MNQSPAPARSPLPTRGGGADPPLESTLQVFRDVQIFRLPPRPSARGYRAQDWDPNTVWRGRLRVLQLTFPTSATARAYALSTGPTGPTVCVLRIEDTTTGDLFGEAILRGRARGDEAAVEPVIDSSRYFVVRLSDRTSGRHAFVGMGFAERSDAFDLNVALMDFEKVVKYDLALEEAGGDHAKAAAAVAAASGAISVGTSAGGSLPDLALKDGQQIAINLGNLAKKLGGNTPMTTTTTAAPVSDDPFAFPPPPPAPSAAATTSTASKRTSGDEWGEFTAFASPSATAPSGTSSSGTGNGGSGWVQF
ncbi:hypothetical protein AMAG_19007 [Allomyces macrogynus ATCC 38327]|uniref:NECAP PHear domain-containing protein n=1 Tax=Allomyces macrogynus (strain ATCC 38327) TaxID=578462 RepID=A0A0L0SLT9_ALLM3|nr:hypothetical protein AMAG_19007 [Allomyces macrogynus ATCC 38327]|eukprot:KNE63486.1 hypothetical protein AMAG_19007 [Allomyces macrogynus ATCC 38327]